MAYRANSFKNPAIAPKWAMAGFISTYNPAQQDFTVSTISSIVWIYSVKAFDGFHGR